MWHGTNKALATLKICVVWGTHTAYKCLSVFRDCESSPRRACDDPRPLERRTGQDCAQCESDESRSILRTSVVQSLGERPSHGVAMGAKDHVLVTHPRKERCHAARVSRARCVAKKGAPSPAPHTLAVTVFPWGLWAPLNLLAHREPGASHQVPLEAGKQLRAHWREKQLIRRTPRPIGWQDRDIYLHSPGRARSLPNCDWFAMKV